MTILLPIAAALATIAMAQSENAAGESTGERLAATTNWMCQLQGLDRAGAVGRLARSGYDMLVLEPTFTVRGSESFDASAMVRQLEEARPRRVVLAYIDIGEAESYRAYWKANWRPPTRTGPGRPDFIIRRDPDGWEENYPVAFWDRRWKRLQRAIVRRLATAGFDGIYLDWVEAYDDPKVAKVARRHGVDPAKEMVRFIHELREAGRSVDPGFVAVAQNAPYLPDRARGYLREIDGFAMETIWYAGEADAPWPSRRGGDIDQPRDPADDYSTPSLIRAAKRYADAGLPVFTLDYALEPDHVAEVYRESSSHGFVPLVSRVSLSRMTPTPPPHLEEPR